jgi:predicted ATPase/class 3 adenylate cyclase
MSDLPTGTVSFLFTDIEGSTALLQQIGDRAYAALLEEHHRLLRDAFSSEGGHEIDTQGDAFFVVFPDARNAVAAAAGAQRAVASHAWAPGMQVRVRMGMHTGEPTLGGDNYVGIDVHRAARICSAGYGGQVLLSERTCELSRDRLPDGVAIKALGEHRLKDLHRPERLYQLLIEGLPADFPSLKTLDARTTNLPSLELTSFIGREREIQEVGALLAAHRLVTLMGPGGTGKTRLSLQTAADLSERFPHGVWLVELAPLADPAGVTQTVATVFSVREVPGRALLDTLADYLRGREALIVLDNCEHLTHPAAELAAALLRGCPKVRILATSREMLGVAGERTYRVPLLSLPDAAGGASVQRLTQFDATRLFLERAALSNPNLTVTDAQAPLIIDICARLDGLPLAIELAAARARVLTIGQIAKRLDDRFRLLTGGSRTGLPHHQTLRATVDWSYDLLSEDERGLWRRLSVFAGGFSLEAAEAICADGFTEDVLELLVRLVDKSLVIVDATSSDVRYRMLETIRSYGRDRLRESGEEREQTQHHLAWHVRLAEEADPHLRGPDQVRWLDRIELDYDDFRQALEASKTEAPALEARSRLAIALARFWSLRGYLREGRAWLEGFVSEPALPPAARAGVAYGAGTLAFQQGDYAQAETMCNESLSIYRALRDTSGIALVLNILGSIARNRGDYQRAGVLLEESIALSRQAGDAWALADALNILGVASRRRGDHDRATALFEESLALWRKLGDKSGLATSLGHLGVVARHHGDYVRARTLHDESLKVRRELRDNRNTAAALSSLAVVAYYQGDARADALFEESLELSRELGDKISIAAALNTQGLVKHRQGDSDGALQVLEEGLTLSEELGDPLNTATAMSNLGLVVFKRGDHARAAILHAKSLPAFHRLGSTAGVLEALAGLARACAALGKGEQAARLMGAADALRDASGLTLPPPEAADYEQAAADIRALVPETTFAPAWALGRTTPLGDVIDEAVR